MNGALLLSFVLVIAWLSALWIVTEEHERLPTATAWRDKEALSVDPEDVAA